MSLHQDKFDSKILKRDVFKLYLGKEVAQSRIDAFLTKISSKSYSIFCFSTFSNKNINLLNSRGFDFISIRNTYINRNYSSTPKLNYRLKKGFSLFFSSAKVPSLKEESVSDLVGVIGRTSRYFKDKKIGLNKALSVYRHWVDNSLFCHYANECIGIVDKSCELVALVVLKIKDGEGCIDLIGVRDKFQNLGFGTLLLCKSFEFFRKHNIEKVSVITEGENVAANAFYQKNGFILNKIELVFHKHYFV